MMDSLGRYLRLGKVVIDLGLMAVAFALAYLARFEGDLSTPMRVTFWCSLPLVLAIKYGVLCLFSVPRLAWRSVSTSEIFRIVQALIVGTLVLIGLRVAIAYLPPLQPYFLVPFGVLIIDVALNILIFLGVRGFWRIHMDRAVKVVPLPANLRAKRAVLLGTDHRTIRIARDLAARPMAGIDLVGILAEDVGKVGMIMSGLPVLGTEHQMRDVAQEHGIEQVLVPLYPDGAVVRRLVQQCDQSGLKARILDVGSGGEEKVDLARLRAITVEDLLRRPPVRLEGNAVRGMLQSKAVMVTGSGGSIGSQLCREICHYHPRVLILVEQAENSLFHIHRYLAKEFPHVSLVPAIADVCDRARMEQIFRTYEPEVVVHAAAHKHVPMMEWNVREAIKNNVEGTKQLADLASHFGARRFVMVSTDKAVRPTSVMGASKRVAELYVQALAHESRLGFVTVRFGNVLGSAGSVIPLFQEQIAAGGPVTVTHPEMKRYFMTIPEASQLVLEAGSLGQGGEIFILDMGEPVKIVDLAEDMIRLAGLRPGVDIEVRFSGIRPGEKLFEELSLEEENAERTRHPRIYIGRKPSRQLDVLARQIAELIESADSGDPHAMREKFKAIIPDFDYISPKAETRTTLNTQPELVTEAPKPGTSDEKVTVSR